MKNLYNQDYYEKGIESGVSCYTNYRWIPELTIPMAARIIEYLGISEEDRILDFGCAKGYLVYAFRLLHREAYGYDISEYAVNQAPKEVVNYISNDMDKFGVFDWTIAKDVFEHIEYDELNSILKKIREKSKNVFAVIPLGDGTKYYIPAYELDKTHIIREDNEWWINKFEENGYSVCKATYSVKYIKENWNKWEKGNGFYILKSEQN